MKPGGILFAVGLLGPLSILQSLYLGLRPFTLAMMITFVAISCTPFLVILWLFMTRSGAMGYYGWLSHTSDMVRRNGTSIWLDAKGAEREVSFVSRDADKHGTSSLLPFGQSSGLSWPACPTLWA